MFLWSYFIFEVFGGFVVFFVLGFGVWCEVFWDVRRLWILEGGSMVRVGLGFVTVMLLGFNGVGLFYWGVGSLLMFLFLVCLEL